MAPIPPRDLEDPARLEQIRRSIVMLPPEQPVGLSPQDALAVIEALQRLMAICVGCDRRPPKP